MNAFLERGGHWVVAQFILFVAVLAAGFAEPFPFSFSGHRALGWVIAIAGFVVAVAATFTLGRNLTPYPKPLDEGELIERGLYRVVRHPIYTGVVLIMIGFGLARGDLLALGLASLTLPFFYAKTSHEEDRLLESYPSYPEYQQRVKQRILPWVL